jgi:hypothetical protein
MTALAQGAAGVALVMGFALLCIRQVRAATMLLAVQSSAIAICAVGLHRPTMALPPLLLAAGVWFASDHFPPLEPGTAPVGGAKLGVGAGAILTVLCQSQGILALPLAVLLLSVLLAATRTNRLMQVIALIGVQNGVVLAACLIVHDDVLPPMLLPVACFGLALPLALGVLIPMAMPRGRKSGDWIGWFDLALSLAVFALTLSIPLDALASMFAPLLGLDGVLRSCQRRKRAAMSPAGRGLALLTNVFLVLTVCPSSPIIAWLAILGAIATSSLPTIAKRWNEAVVAFCGAGVALFGFLVLALAPSVPGYFSVFAGFTAIAAIVPDLAAVLAILILRLANQAPWPPGAEVLGLAIALIALLGCAVMLRGKSPRSSVPLLQQSQASIAALALCLGQADGRFAALVVLILLILTRAAARITDGIASTLAIAGLGGVPPLGVFPGVVLVVLAVIDRNVWLLLPVGVAYAPILVASSPRSLRAFSPRAAIPSAGWLPLAISLLAGYCAPDGLVRWWHVLTAGRG